MTRLKKSPFISILSLSVLIAFLGCSALEDVGGSTQSTTKLTASPFVAELNGSVTKTLAIDAPEGSHIAWVGFDHSGDYNYFKVESLTVNGTEIANKSGTSSEIFSDITVWPSANASSPSTPGVTSNSLLATITYKAKKPMESDTDPYTATLLVVFDEPDTKTVQIHLQGYVQGICDDCRLQPDTDYVYRAVDNDGDGLPDFALYVCDDQAVAITPAEFKSTAPLPDTEDTVLPGPYAISYIPLTADGTTDFHIYEADKKPGFVIFDAGDDASLAASIPDFDLPAVIELPGGLETIPVAMEDNLQFICPDDGTGIFTCSTQNQDSGLLLDISDHQLNVEPLTVTNGPIDLSAAPSAGCPNFGKWSGAGTIGVDLAEADEPEPGVDLIIIGVGVVSDSQPSIVDSLNTGIEGGVIVAVMKLTLVETNGL